ncbi:hypothetical protein IAD21_00194 [Abditibacteriota bacterium]|nr:hypothetical protein IAD21_00194 [Abditibacteriota bacterium]
MQPTLLVSLPLVLFSSTTWALAEPGAVQLGCHTPMFAYPCDNPLAAIATALGKDKDAPCFRMSWSDTLGSGWDRDTMFYDKRRGLPKYYDVGGAGERGEEYYRKSYLFTRIKGATVQSLVRKFNTRQNIGKLYPFAFLNILHTLGSPRYKLADYRRGY